MASVRRSLDDTLAYVKERQAFGKPIARFQNTQFELAELETEYELGQAFVDKLLAAHVGGEEIVKEVSMAKWWTTDLQKKVAAACLQLHGGYGFMEEYPISTDYLDAAVQSIYAGTQRDHEGDHRPAARTRRVDARSGTRGAERAGACAPWLARPARHDPGGWIGTGLGPSVRAALYFRSGARPLRSAAGAARWSAVRAVVLLGGG